MTDPKLLSDSRTRLLRIILTVLLCGVLILGIALVTIPMFSNTEWVKQSLLTMLETSAGGPIHIDHLVVHLLPTPRIILSGLTFRSEAPNPRASFQAKHVEVVFGWDSLWRRQLVLTHGTIQEPELTVQIPFVRESKEPAEWTFPDIRQLNIQDGHLHLLREPAGETPTKLSWEQIRLTVSGMEPEGATTIQLSAQTPEQERPSTVALQGTLTLTEPTGSDSGETMNRGIPPFSLQGQLEISHLHLGRVMSFLSDDLTNSLPTRMHVHSEYALTLKSDADILTFTDFQISLDEWEFTGQGDMTGLQTDSPMLKVSGSTSPIAIGRLINLLPESWLPDEVRRFLTDRQVDGTVELLTGSVQGPLNQADSLVAEGVVRVEDGRLLTAPGHPPITQLSGTVAFDPHLVRIRNVHGTVTPFTLAAQEATLSFQDAGLVASIPAFHISEHDWTLTGKAQFTNFKEASPVLAISGSAPSISIQYFAGLLPDAWIPAFIQTVLVDHQVEGSMELVTGSMRWPLNGEEPVTADGVIRLQQGRIVVDPNHPPLTHLAGSVVFDSKLVRILDFQGKLEASNLLIKEATLDLKNSDIWVDLYGGGNIFAQDVVQALLRDPRSRELAEPLAGYRDIQGHIRVAGRLEGSLAHPEQIRIHEGSLAMEHVNLYSHVHWPPITSVTAEMSFDHRRLAVQTLKGQLGNSFLEAKGQWDFRNETRSSNLAVRSTVDSSDLLRLYPSLADSFSTFAGSFETTLTLSGTPTSPDYQLHVDLSDWALASAGIFTKPAHIPGTFDATGHIGEPHTLVITDGELSLPPFKLDVKGSVALQDPPQIRIGFRTESGTGGLLPKGVLLGDERLGLSTLATTVAIQGQNQDWTRWNVQGTIESTDRARRSVAGDSDLGSKVFRLTWIQKDQKANADFSVSNLLIEALLPPDPTPRFTGALSLNTTMNMDLTRPEWVQRFFKGKGNLHLQNGRILTSPVLSKILGMLNVHNVLMGKINILEEGFPVDQLTGTFVVEDGLLTSKDLILKSPVMALAAAGTYDIPTDKFDAIVTISPFGAYSSLLKSIPLFGTLMEGERKGLTTALFEVKGLRTDPQVTYLPLQSLTGGILGLAKFPLDVLKNVLTLPLPEKKPDPTADPATRSLAE